MVKHRCAASALAVRISPPAASSQQQRSPAFDESGSPAPPSPLRCGSQPPARMTRGRSWLRKPSLRRQGTPPRSKRGQPLTMDQSVDDLAGSGPLAQRRPLSPQSRHSATHAHCSSCWRRVAHQREAQEQAGCPHAPATRRPMLRATRNRAIATNPRERTTSAPGCTRARTGRHSNGAGQVPRAPSGDLSASPTSTAADVAVGKASSRDFKASSELLDGQTSPGTSHSPPPADTREPRVRVAQRAAGGGRSLRVVVPVIGTQVPTKQHGS